MKRILIFCVVLTISASCHRKKEKEGEKKQEEPNAIIKRCLSTMISRNNAVTDWDKNLEAKYGLSPLSYQIQEELQKEAYRPYLFFIWFVDIKKNATNYLLTGTIEPSTLLFDKMYFLLECDRKVVEQLTSDPNDILHNYAVVAKVKGVDSPVFFIHANAGGSTVYEEAYCELETGTVVIVRGECLEVLNVGGCTSELREYVEKETIQFDLEQ